MIRKKSEFIVIFIVAKAFIVLVLFSINANSSSTLPISNPQADLQDSGVGLVELPTEPGPVNIPTLNVPTAEPVAPSGTPLPDGQSILNSNCAQCHMQRALNQIKKTRADWETTLVKMKKYGVQITDDEKSILLDYLAVLDKQ